MKIIIRKETAEDYFEVECMTKRAFRNMTGDVLIYQTQDWESDV